MTIKDGLAALLAELAAKGCVESMVEPPHGGGKRPALRWREILKTHEAPTLGEAMTNGHAQSVDAPPEGEGWVRWKDVVYIAEAGVPRGFALRRGKARRAELKREIVGLTDEQLGIKLVARKALQNAITHGSIERRGDWCRLLRDPIKTQRPWLEAAYTILGKAHPTLTGEYTPKPPKTLVSVKESALGRRLLPEEFVKREAGYAGTWDPEHIEVRVRLPHTSSVAELEEFIDAYRQRAAEAPRIIEPRPFEVNLPKKRRS